MPNERAETSSESLHIRCLPDDLEQFAAAAERAGVTRGPHAKPNISQWALQTLRQAAKQATERNR